MNANQIPFPDPAELDLLAVRWRFPQRQAAERREFVIALANLQSLKGGQF
jgi:hypothetical protein